MVTHAAVEIHRIAPGEAPRSPRGQGLVDYRDLLETHASTEHGR